MTGRWRRLGRLALDVSQAPWAATHAALPVADPAGDDSWWVYLTARDTEGRGRIGRARLTLRPSPTLSPLESEPILDLGSLGAFDDSGVTGASIVVNGARRYLYYTGWSRGVTVPFYLAAGLAVSDNGGPFRRLSPAPLLDRSQMDPYLTASPFVRLNPRGWRMWYVSATEWRQMVSGPRHYYNIRYAESDDGVVWRRAGRVCLDYADETEYTFGRPCVTGEDGNFQMWFSVRGDCYRIRYAESADGVEWTRSAVAGLDPETDAWDSEMVEYPWVFQVDGRTFMLYNGNGYGQTGVGIAIWEEG